MKVPQRDVNLARKLHNMSHQAGAIIYVLLDPEAETPVEHLQNVELTGLENQMLDCIGFIREYRRKVNPVEVRGQRG